MTVEETDFLFCKQKPFSMREGTPFLQLSAERGLFVLEVDMRDKLGRFVKGQIAWNKGKKYPQFSGESHPNWRGGRYNNLSGYVFIYTPKHPFCNKDGCVREHRLIMEKHLKRYLLPWEIVHHKGIRYPMGSKENRQDNRIENLKLYTSPKIHNSDGHTKYKYVEILPEPLTINEIFSTRCRCKEKTIYQVTECNTCKKLFWKQKYKKTKTCSASCGMKYRWKLKKRGREMVSFYV